MQACPLAHSALVPPLLPLLLPLLEPVTDWATQPPAAHTLPALQSLSLLQSPLTQALARQNRPFAQSLVFPQCAPLAPFWAVQARRPMQRITKGRMH